MTEQKEFDFLKETINEIRKGASLEDIKTKLIIRKYDIKQQLTLTDVGCSLDFDKLRKQFNDILKNFDEQKIQDWLDKKS